jgi:hypothetical protein
MIIFVSTAFLGERHLVDLPGLEMLFDRPVQDGLQLVNRREIFLLLDLPIRLCRNLQL